MLPRVKVSNLPACSANERKCLVKNRVLSPAATILSRSRDTLETVRTLMVDTGKVKEADIYVFWKKRTENASRLIILQLGRKFLKLADVQTERFGLSVSIQHVLARLLLLLLFFFFF